MTTNVQSVDTSSPGLVQEWFNTLYATLFLPKSLFESTAEQQSVSNRLLLYSMATSTLVFTFTPIVDYIYTGGEPWMLFFTIPLSVVGGTLSLLFIAGVISLMAFTFQGQTRFKTLFTLLGFATAPWTMMGPISAITSAGLPGVLFSGLLTQLIWLWSVSLGLMAILKTYKIPLERGLLLGLLPFLFFLLFTGMAVAFFQNLLRLIPM